MTTQQVCRAPQLGVSGHQACPARLWKAPEILTLLWALCSQIKDKTPLAPRDGIDAGNEEEEEGGEMWCQLCLGNTQLSTNPCPREANSAPQSPPGCWVQSGQVGPWGAQGAQGQHGVMLPKDRPRASPKPTQTSTLSKGIPRWSSHRMGAQAWVYSGFSLLSLCF